MSGHKNYRYEAVPVELKEVVVEKDPLQSIRNSTSNNVQDSGASGYNKQVESNFLKPETKSDQENDKGKSGSDRHSKKHQRTQPNGLQEQREERRPIESKRGTGIGVQTTPRDIDVDLHEACKILDSGRVLELLRNGADPNALIEDLAPLDVTGEIIPHHYRSLLKSFVEIIKALTMRGGHPTPVTGARYRETPLHVAINLACEQSDVCQDCIACEQCLQAIRDLCAAGYRKLLHKPSTQQTYEKGKPRTIDKEVFTALHAAVSKKWLNGVITLIEEGADVNARVTVPAYKKSGAKEKFNRAETVLHLAVYLQWTEGVNLLLDKGAEPNSKLSSYTGGHTPLHMASQKLNVECLKLLLDHGANMNETNALELTPLDVTGSLNETRTAADFLEVIRLLISRGSQPSLNNKVKYQTPLHTALSFNCIEVVHELDKVGYKELLQNKKGDTPLHEVVNSCSEIWLKELVSLYKGPGLDAKNSEGETALHIAVRKLWLFGVTTLLQHGADITLKTNKGKTVLHVLPNKKNYIMLKELLRHKDCHKIINEKDKSNSLPLFRAISFGHEKCAFLLIDANADVNLKAENTRNIIHNVVKARQWRILNGLFNKKRGDMDKMKETTISSNKFKNATPLHIAVLENSSKCVEILIVNKCNLMAQVQYENTHYTPLELAVMKGYHEVVKVILDKEPSLVNKPDVKGLMPIHRASILHHSEVIKTIVDHGCDLAAKCSLSDNTSDVTAMDLFINRVPGAVDLLESILSDAITVHKDGIELYYKILLPKVECSDMRQLRVLDALVQTGDQVDKGRLFTHPTVESFLAIQWNRMKNWYYTLLVIFLFFLTVPFHILIFIIFYTKSDIFSSWFTTVCVVSMILSSIIFFCYEGLCLYLKITHSKYFRIWKFNTDVILFNIRIVLWILKIIVMLFLLVYPLVRLYDNFSQELAICAIICLWIQFMYLMSRVPVYGIYMLMFFEVFSNFMIVMLSFIWLIFAFVTGFVIEYHGSAPFSSLTEGFLKTVVMMTSELDYNELFKSIDANMNVVIFTKIVFLIFLLVVGIVIMNIVLAKAILDVKKVDRLRKLAEFLSTCEQCLLLLYPLHNWLNNRVGFKSMPQNNNIEIDKKLFKFDESNVIANNIIRSIMEKAFIVTETGSKEQKGLKTNHSATGENVTGSETNVIQLIQANTDKINELKQLMEQVLSKLNK